MRMHVHRTCTFQSHVGFLRNDVSLCIVSVVLLQISGFRHRVRFISVLYIHGRHLQKLLLFWRK
ncbi:MAG: hypothetical protein ABW185_26840 [Sedimenticola sp.]